MMDVFQCDEDRGSRFRSFPRPPLTPFFLPLPFLKFLLPTFPWRLVIERKQNSVAFYLRVWNPNHAPVLDKTGMHASNTPSAALPPPSHGARATFSVVSSSLRCNSSSTMSTATGRLGLTSPVDTLTMLVQDTVFNAPSTCENLMY